MKRLLRIHALVFSLLLTGTVAGESPALPSASARSQDGLIRVVVDDHRPLAAAANRLSRLLRVPICYEDPPWSHPSQLEKVEVPDQGRAEAPPRYLTGPRRFRWEATLVPREGVSQETKVLDLLEQLLEQYHGSGLPGTFSVHQSGRFFYINPVSYKNEEGHQVPYDSPIDTLISLQPTRGPIQSLIDRVFEELEQEVEGIPVEKGLMFIKPFFREQGTIEAREEPAWRVLQEVLEQSEIPVFWLMMYGPEPEPAGYALSILPIK